MYFLWYLLFPLTGAAIGFSTNWLAVSMLFRPYSEKRLFGVRLPFTPGLMPKNQQRLAKKLAQAIGAKILTPELLAQALAHSPLWAGLSEMTLAQIFARWGLEPPLAYVRRGLAALRTASGEGAALGDALSGASIAAIKAGLRRQLPALAEPLRQWPEKFPHWDDQLEAWVQQLVKENTGRLASLFVDHKRVYASIKEGLAGYLAEEENLHRLADKIDELLDRFCAHRGWVDYLPEDADERLVAFAEQTLSRFPQEKKAAVMHAFEEVAAHVARQIDIEGITEGRINAFSPQEAEALVLSVVRRELQAIMALGGLLGFFMGLLPLVF